MTDSSTEQALSDPRSVAGGSQRPHRHTLVLAAAFLGALVCGLMVSFTIDRSIHRDVVLRGVLLEDVVLSGRAAPEAAAAIDRIRERLLARPLQFSVADARFVATPKDLGYSVDVQAAVAEALSLGRQRGLLRQFSWWLGRLFTPVRLSLQGSLDEDVLDARLDEWEAEALPDRADAGSIRYDGKLRVAYPVAGRRIDRAGLKERIEARLRRGGATPVDLPVVREQPILAREAVDVAARRAGEILAGPVQFVSEDALRSLVFSVDDLGRALSTRPVEQPTPHLAIELRPEAIKGKLDPLRAEFEVPSLPARFEVDAGHRVEIVPAKAGVVIDEERLMAFLLDPEQGSSRSRPLPLKPGPPPTLTTEQARALNVTRLVSSFVTYHRCCEARVKNIHRIADLVDGVVLRPGQTFSLNDHVGPRTHANGFVLAPGIEEGDMVKTYGGGVSQFTTTLFNAVLDGGYEIVQRQPHSYYFPRYPVGHEATLSYPTPDLVFKNDTQSGMLLKAHYGAKFIKVLIYGGKSGRKVTRKVGKRFDPTDPPIEHVANSALDPASAVLKSRGTAGWSVVVARIIEYPDGGTETERRKVVYNARPRVVEVHPCNIPEGAEGYTGDECPEPALPDGGVDAATW